MVASQYANSVCFTISGKMTVLVCVGKLAVIILGVHCGVCKQKKCFVEHFCLQTEFLQIEVFVNQGITVFVSFLSLSLA